jgi:protocatechuate 3,4-dioxygenase beta subunit
VRRVTRLLPVALVGLTLLSASGCSYVYRFDLTITVVSATDGKPIHGARVTLQFHHSSQESGTYPVTRLTDTTGKMSRRFYVTGSEVTRSEGGGYRFRGTWPVRVACDGYVPQEIDIKPTTKADHRNTTPLNVIVRLEPESAP